MSKSLKEKTMYSSWAHMKQRCNGTSNIEDTRNYQTRGISYDLRWEYFENFFKDMETGWKEGLTLDRINNNGNYCKENCRWATRKVQAVNRRNTQFFTLNGVSKTLTDWAKELGVKRSTLAQRYYCYNWTIEKTLTIQCGN